MDRPALALVEVGRTLRGKTAAAARVTPKAVPHEAEERLDGPGNGLAALLLDDDALREEAPPESARESAAEPPAPPGGAERVDGDRGSGARRGGRDGVARRWHRRRVRARGALGHRGSDGGLGAGVRELRDDGEEVCGGGALLEASERVEHKDGDLSILGWAEGNAERGLHRQLDAFEHARRVRGGAPDELAGEEAGSAHLGGERVAALRRWPRCDHQPRVLQRVLRREDGLCRERHARILRREPGDPVLCDVGLEGARGDEEETVELRVLHRRRAAHGVLRVAAHAAERALDPTRAVEQRGRALDRGGEDA